ncbi:hypothetical protein ACF06P_39665 [Streptomyces sp. NPDC015684]|uniref:hypothetical protein n=1 Tax=Streptomyces sp. NPDC015684 TaxID=3364963 RepID=UPI0036F55483
MPPGDVRTSTTYHDDLGRTASATGARGVTVNYTVKYDVDPRQRETVRHLQDGSQTLLAYTAAGNVDYYSTRLPSPSYQPPTGQVVDATTWR